MRYVALTQKTAEWLLAKSDLMRRLSQDLADGRFDGVATHDFAEGPMRATGSDADDVLALWHADFLRPTGHEQWGLIRLAPPHGIQAIHDRARETFERAVYVVNQRLQGLRLESMDHKYWEADDVHTCEVRGTSPSLHLAYVEEEFEGENAMLVIGPSPAYRFLVNDAVQLKRRLPSLIAAANSFLNPTEKRPLLPTTALSELRRLLTPPASAEVDSEFADYMAELERVPGAGAHRTSRLTYSQWVAPGGPLAEQQREILQHNVLMQHPLRIRGPAGSGKTLLMQLLAMKLLTELGQNVKLLYITHNLAMAQAVSNRFHVLGAGAELGKRLEVTTLAEYGRKALELKVESLIDADAEQTKSFQLAAVRDALRAELRNAGQFPKESLIEQARANEAFQNVLARLIVNEISVAIKGSDYQNDRTRYVQSERKLSRLHGIMSADERDFVFNVFRAYYQEVFVQNRVLDSDDLAISLFARLNTPLWQLRRRDEAFDFVFIDEAQLFNENERRVFHLLTRGDRTHVPIAVAFDRGQDLMGQTSLGTFGVDSFDTTTQDLRSSHRCTAAIMRLAVFVLSKTTDLFSVDEFPDFTDDQALIANDHPLARAPQFVNVSSSDLAGDVIDLVQELRRQLRRIAVVVLSDDYAEIANALMEDPRAKRLSIKLLWRRGEPLASPDRALVVVSRPSYIGGQEFDAVVAIGLEEGIVPPHVSGADTLSYALEQQSYREIYVTFSRARYQLYVAIRRKRDRNRIMEEARQASLITYA